MSPTLGNASSGRLRVGSARFRHALDAAHAREFVLLRDLIAIPSVRGTETAIHTRIAEELSGLGARIDLVAADPTLFEADPEYSPPTDVPPQRALNVVARWGDLPPSLLLFAHLDTEPVGVPERWETPPFEATERDGRVFGLGAPDDKAGVASILGAVQALDALGVRADVGILVAAVHGKQGGTLGTLPVIRSLVDLPAAVYCHPPETGAGLGQIKVGSRGIMSIELIVRGRTPAPVEMRTPASADPRDGVNAIGKAMKLAAALEEGLAVADDPDVRLSVNRIAGGRDRLAVPDRSRIEATLSFGRGTVQSWLAHLERLVAAASEADDWLRKHPARLRVIGLRANPASMEPDEPLAGWVEQAMAASGERPDRYHGHVASDIRFPIRCLGAPCVGFGALGGGFYGPNEWVEVDSMRRTTEVLVRTILDRHGFVGAPASASTPPRRRRAPGQ